MVVSHTLPLPGVRLVSPGAHAMSSDTLRAQLARPLLGKDRAKLASYQELPLRIRPLVATHARRLAGTLDTDAIADPKTATQRLRHRDAGPIVEHYENLLAGTRVGIPVLDPVSDDRTADR